MRAIKWDKVFYTSTRGRIVNLLRRKNYTVSELAKELSLTQSAIRTHLATLERDGLVQHAGMRPGLRKPYHTYKLTQEALQLFPEACGPIISQLVEVLAERYPSEVLIGLFGEIGHRMAAAHTSSSQLRSQEEKIQQAIEVLGELGGLAELKESEGKHFIKGYDCPLSFLVGEHHEGCHIAAVMVADIIGEPVRICCEYSGTPRCCFEILPPVKD